MPPRLKTALFGLFAVLLPLAAVAGVEGSLRLAGVQRDARTPFVPIPGKETHLVLNPAYVQRYFPAFDPAVPFTPFEAVKSPQTFRVFVLGESSAAGFPYQFYNGFPARLQERLLVSKPAQRIEVVNLGMSAVNSYTLWDLAPAVLRHQPDAVVIYTGHNEYYGAFGVGSAFNPLGEQVWLKRLVLKLKRTALGASVEAWRTADRDLAAQEDTRTLMAQAVREASIPLESPLYQAGLAQCEANLRSVVDLFTRAGLPVFVGTLASNLADQPPLGDDAEALAAFRRGQALLASGDTAAARAAFVEARDRDEIRFRAPGAVNEILRSLQADNPRVTLVDTEAALRAASPGTLESDALFDDHLHPNATGYDVMAAAFAEALLAAPPLGPAAPVVQPPTPVDPVERAHVALQLARLEGGYPFNKTTTPEEQLGAFRARLDAALRSGNVADSLAATAVAQQGGLQALLAKGLRHALDQRDTTAALSYYRSLSWWQPFNAPMQEQALSLPLNAPRYDAASLPLALLFRNWTQTTFAGNAAGALLLRAGRLPDAATVLNDVERQAPDDPVLLFNKARLLVLQGDTTGAQRYFARYQSTR